MAHAPVNRIIPRLAVPTIISMLVSSIYNMADTFFVSQIGTSASGAVGIIFSAMAIIQALAFMVGMGSGNFMTRSIGAGNRKLAQQIASIAFFTGAAVGIAIALICLPNLHTVVMLLGSTETIAPYAEDYARYIFLAAPFMICSFIMNNLLRFQGKAFFCHDRHYHRRNPEYHPGSDLHLHAGDGNCRCSAGYGAFPVYQLLHPAFYVQHPGKLYYHPPAGVCAYP